MFPEFMKHLIKIHIFDIYHNKYEFFPRLEVSCKFNQSQSCPRPVLNALKRENL